MSHNMEPYLVAAQELFKLGLSGVIIVGLSYAVVSLWKKNNETQEARVRDSKERENTVTIALQETTKSLDSFGNNMQSILIKLDKNGKDKDERQN
jgi:hypothetical protein